MKIAPKLFLGFFLIAIFSGINGYVGYLGIITVVELDDPEMAEAEIDKTLGTMVLLTTISVLFAIGIGFFISTSIAIPAKKLGDVADKIADGDFDVDAKVKSSDEIGELSIRFDRMRNRIKEANTELQLKDTMKEEFVSMISHELKTPLTPIIGYCDALKRSDMMGSLSEKQIRAVDTIYSNATKLRKLIGDVLDAQKLELDRMRFVSMEFEIDDVIKDIANDFKLIIEERKIQLVTSMKEKLTLKSDKNRIEQVLENLVHNAIDFVPEEKGKIEVGVEQRQDSVVFSVKDNGRGIPKDKQKDLFKKFYQVDTSITREHPGSGLGLAVCKGIVDKLGGKIWMESVIGKGSTFYFSIPL